MSGLDVRLHRAFHDPPLAHPKLVALALLVERFHGALEDVGAQSLMVGLALRRARRLQNLDIQSFVPEEAFVTRYQQWQVVDGIHHRNSNLLQRSGGGAHVADSPLPIRIATPNSK